LPRRYNVVMRAPPRALPRATPSLRLASLVLAAVAAIALNGAPAPVAALPPAGADVLPLAGAVQTSSRLGIDHVVLTGRIEIERSAPRLDGGVEVVDLAVTALELRGASRIGAVTVTQRSSAPARGELRSSAPGQEFPASLHLDLYADIAAPASTFGPLLLHNEEVLRLRPRAGGQPVPIDAWPPSGAMLAVDPLFAVDNDGDGAVDEDTADEDGDGLIDEDGPGAGDEDLDGLIDEDPSPANCTDLCDGDGDGARDEDPACVPLFDEQRSQAQLGLCVRDLTLQVVPALPTYSVRRGGPSRLHPADLLAITPSNVSDRAQAPFVHVPCASLGLSADGCDGGTDGDIDDLDALSYGHDLPAGAAPGVQFSVGPTAQGTEGSAVRAQRLCPPASPGSSPEAEPDIFGSSLDGANELLLDGNGPVGTCPPAFPLGLVESAFARDDLDALDAQDPSAADPDGDGVPDRAVYFSLDAASPSLTSRGVTEADVLRTVAGNAPAVYASRAALGLVPGDDLDGLCLGEDGDGVFGANDQLVFSLAPGSPTLALIDAGPGDLLAPGSPPRPRVRVAALGLLTGDDVDAVACGALPHQAGGDVNCDGATDSIDAALVLQHDSGLLEALSCAEDADVNKDGAIDSMDAHHILRFVAGLIDRLPVPR